MEKKQQPPLKPATPKKHKIERIDLNIESIITETYLQSQQKAREEAEKHQEKQAEKHSVYKQKTGTADAAKDNRVGSPELDEQIEEDIIVYQHHEFTPHTTLAPNTPDKNEKAKQESFKNHLFNQIQNQKRAANEQSLHKFSSRETESHNEPSQKQQQQQQYQQQIQHSPQQQQAINKNTDKVC